MNETELQHRLALSQIDGLGPVRLRKLITLAGSAEALFNPGPELFLRAEKSYRDVLSSIAPQAPKLLPWAAKKVAQLKKSNFTTWAFDEPGYPLRLTQCHDAPPLLFTVGAVDLEHPRTVAIVGTRQATQYGLDFTRELVEFLSAYGVVIISGLAHGIDAMAHQTAIELNMPTWAVLGHGFDRIYPSRHRSMADQMLQNGGWITEFVPGSIPERENFPKRNRIIAGLCDLCIVVEAARKGGALITAELANSYGRDVMALPGRCSDEYSQGCNSLIRTHKAHLIERPYNIAELLNWKKKGTPEQTQITFSLSADESVLLKCFPAKPERISINEISLASGFEIPEALALLLQLELKKAVRSFGGGYFSR